MSFVRRMKPTDLLHFNQCNLDPLTETYHVGFYLDYLVQWPHLCNVIEGQDGQIEAYILGKTESSPYTPPGLPEPFDPKKNPDPNYLPFHGHITALTVAPPFRKLGHATRLTTALEETCQAEGAWFIDLFVREENEPAQELYKKLGYSVYRRVVGYYDAMNDKGGSDAFDMRKPLKRDKDRATVRSNGENIHVLPEDVW